MFKYRQLSVLLILTCLLFPMAQASFNITQFRIAIITCIATLGVTNALNADAMGMDVGIDYDDAEDVIRGRLLFDWNVDSWRRSFGSTHVDFKWELGFGQSTSENFVQPTFGVAPTFVWTNDKIKFPLSFETSIGGSYIASTSIGKVHQSTHFQFSQSFAIITQYKDISIGYRFQHQSNGNVKFPNNGLNFNSIVFKYNY